MGVSDLDPDAGERRPWNAGSVVEAKRPLKPPRRMGSTLLSRRAPTIARQSPFRLGNR